MNIKQEFRKHFRPRPRVSHKDDYGRIFVLAGSVGMSGACYLTSAAALRSGAGLVTVGVPKSLLLPLARRMTEAMTKGLPETKQGSLARTAFGQASSFLKTQDVLAIGPGLSQNPETQAVIRKIILSSKKPMVIDADGLNAFQGKSKLFRIFPSTGILTPHPGEFVRLFGGLVPKTDLERKKKALAVAKKFKIILVLKGHHTIVASPKNEVFVNPTGNPGMATAGSGDVLTGIMAAMLGQKIEPFKAACFGVYLHGLAGDLAVKEKGEASLIASDIIHWLPKAFQKIIK